MNQLLGDFTLFVSIFGVFLSLLLLYFIRRSSKSNIYLSVFFFLSAMYTVSVYIINFAGSARLLAAFYGTVSPVYFLLGPFGFLYIKSVLKDDARLTRSDLLHFIPFLIQLVNSLPYIFTSYAYKIQHVSILISDIGAIPRVNTGWFFSPAVNYLLRPGHIFAYGVAGSILVYKWQQKEKIEEVSKIVIRWLNLFTVTSTVLFGSSFFVTLWAYSRPDTYMAIHKGQSLILIGFVPFILLNGSIFLFPQILYGLPRWQKNTRPEAMAATGLAVVPDNTADKDPKKGLQMKGESLSMLHRQVGAYLVSEKPFLQKDFSLAKMSVETKIPAHHLSYYFNYYAKEKFTNWRNRHRIAYAVDMIKSGQFAELSLEGIALQSGFSSRVTFFTVFKNEMGMSPSQYVETMQETGKNPGGLS